MTLSFHMRLQKKRREEMRKKYALCVGVFLLIFSFAIYFFTMFEPVQKNYLYPYPYQELVEHYAEEYHVDSALVASVIMNESKFKNDVHSHRGAIGLMQLMPDTAEWIAEQMGDDGFSVEKLHEPETNIRYGTWYLSSLQREFAGNDILVLAAYNAGKGNVYAWMQDNNWAMDFDRIQEIPYEETKLYVRAVLKNRVKYTELYKKTNTE
jgi:soluble lytic murein transglycosylase